MAKQVKRPTPKEQGVLGRGERAAVASALPWMLGLPAQVRLSAREQQPRPPAVKGGKRGGRGR
jgi:hypothetical protein